jgi:predicted GNAT family acetyltransferase
MRRAHRRIDDDLRLDRASARPHVGCWRNPPISVKLAAPMQDDELQIRQEESEGRGAFVIDAGGKRLALQSYRRVDGNHVVIDHTQVDDSLRGRGVARRLLDASVAWARTTGTRIAATCPYAKAQFEKDPSIRDVLEG